MVFGLFTAKIKNCEIGELALWFTLWYSNHELNAIGSHSIPVMFSPQMRIIACLFHTYIYIEVDSTFLASKHYHQTMIIFLCQKSYRGLQERNADFAIPLCDRQSKIAVFVRIWNKIWMFIWFAHSGPRRESDSDSHRLRLRQNLFNKNIYKYHIRFTWVSYIYK